MNKNQIAYTCKKFTIGKLSKTLVERQHAMILANNIKWISSQLCVYVHPP